MSSTDQTHKEYLAHQNGVVYWPFTAWDAIVGKPDDLAHKSDITVAINGLNKFDPNKVFTKDEVNAAIVKAIGDLQDKIYGGDVNAALDTIKELQDAYNGSNTIIQRLLTQMANKANVGDSYTKGDSDARYPVKSDVDNLSVGGRNYALNTATLLVGSTISLSQPLSYFAGQTVTLSVQVDVDNAQPVTGGNNRIGAEFSYTNHLNQTSYFGVWKNLTVGESFHGRVSQTTQLDSIVTADGGERQLFVQTTGTNAKASLLMFELGSHSSDWVPAPEDMATKADIPDITPLAKQVDLSLVEQYGLPRNYWIVKNQTSGYSMDSTGNPTVANASVVVSDYVPLDRTGQFEFLGWNGLGSSLVAVYYYDVNKNYLTTTMWTTPAAVTPATKVREVAVEIWKYGPSNASFIRVESHLGLDAKLAIWSEVFRENSDYVPALEDLKTGTVDLSNYYDKETVDSKLAASNVYPKHAVIDLTTVGIEIADLSWVTHGGRLEITQLSETEGFMDLNMIVECGNVQPHNTVWENKLTIPLTGFPDLAPDGSMYGYATGYPSYTDGGVFFSTFVENNKAGKFSIGFRTVAGDIGANDWRVINLHLPLGKG